METDIITMITGYGALGVVTAYFMYKDYTLNKSIEKSLDNFTIALNTLIGKGLEKDE